MKKEYQLQGVSEYKNEENVSERILPSRRSRHQRPLAFFEKPAFSLIVFILFVVILGSIFIYYKFIKDSNDIHKLNTNKSAFENKLNDDVTKPMIENKDDHQSVPSIVPVVNTPEPVIKENNEDEFEANIEENTNEEPNNELSNESKNKPIKSITHHVVEDDTLYGLSMKYYGSAKPEYRQKIIDANNLKDEKIVLNSKLIIPEPIITP